MEKEKGEVKGMVKEKGNYVLRVVGGERGELCI